MSNDFDSTVNAKRAGFFNDLSRGLDMKGQFRGRVVQRVDPKGEGRVGVFIPALFTEHPADAKDPAPTTSQIDKSIFANAADLPLKQLVKEDNFIWVRPQGALEGGGGGTHFTPSKGSLVVVNFEGGDPNRPYFGQGASPTLNGESVRGSALGRGMNVEGTAANFKDPEKKPDVHIIHEWPNGNIIYADSNPDVNAIVMELGAGHRIVMHHAQQQGIYLKTAGGHLIQLDDTSKEIRLSTQSGNAKLTLNDNGDITLQGSGTLTLQGAEVSVKGPTTFHNDATVEGKTAMKGAATADAGLAAKSSLTLDGKPVKT